MANVVIDIAAEFTGARAFKKAQKSTFDLDKSVKNLGKSLGLTLSTTAVLAFAKASIKAFADEDKAIRSLSRTLKNLGLGQSGTTERVNAFIDTLSRATGVLDDDLRPSMETFLRATGSITKSQDLLSLALDISAGTGKDLSSVVGALQKAYLGNNTALTRLGVGLTKAELKASNFEEITAKLAKLFDGQAAEAADSFAGQLAKITVAADNAKEIIGKGMVDALNVLSKNEGVGELTTQMETFAQLVADATVGLATLADTINNSKIGGPIVDFLKWYNKHSINILTLLEFLAGKKKTTSPFQTGMSVTGATDYYTKQQDAIEKAEKEAEARRLAAIKAAAAAKAKLDKANAAKTEKLAKAAAMFDMEKIQVAAALKGKITAEEKLRLELQQAILNENDELADKLQKKLEASQIATAKLTAEIIGIKPAVNPFDAWLTTLDDIARKLGMIAGVNYNPTQNKDRNYDLLGGAGAGAGLMPGPVVLPGSDLMPGGGVSGTVDTGPPAPFYPSFAELENMFPYIPKMSSAASSSATITVNVDAGAVVMQDDLVTIINDAVIAAQKNGYTQLPNGAIVK